MLVNDDRQLLAQQEEALMHCLIELSTGNSMLYIDDALEETANMLLKKRCRAIERCQPKLKDQLGDKFDSTFQDFVRAHPSVHKDGPCADAKAFTKYATANSRLGYLRTILHFLHH